MQEIEWKLNNIKVANIKFGIPKTKNHKPPIDQIKNTITINRSSRIQSDSPNPYKSNGLIPKSKIRSQNK